MVYLILEARALADVIKLSGVAIWVGSNVLTESSHKELVAKGFNVTRFDHPINAEKRGELEAVLEIIKDHHPTESIWVQYASQ